MGSHAYTLLWSGEVHGHHLLCLRNAWGEASGRVGGVTTPTTQARRGCSKASGRSRGCVPRGADSGQRQADGQTRRYVRRELLNQCHTCALDGVEEGGTSTSTAVHLEREPQVWEACFFALRYIVTAVDGAFHTTWT